MNIIGETSEDYTLDRHDLAADREDQVLLSDRLWRRYFGADPGVVGRTIRLNERAFYRTGEAARIRGARLAGRGHRIIRVCRGTGGAHYIHAAFPVDVEALFNAARIDSRCLQLRTLEPPWSRGNRHSIRCFQPIAS